MNAGKGILQKPGAWSSTEPGMLCNTLKHTALTSIDTLLVAHNPTGLELAVDQIQ
jgi:hypothetical protein